ncbi:zinc ABC transporter substrate-binding protein [Pannus brasiliensis CCIBt3594]|uniref:Zinc ABC transporter substrate-binding protein n=1 Tax=Pannus brasiliensis CCIBt3594 TaxID=1427578 RepID=A0AAW9QQF1_9CHRO
MTKALRITAIGWVLLMATLTGCGSRASSPETEVNQPLPVTVSIVPQKYFVQRVGGDKVAVNALIRPGVDPHTYEPKPEDLKTLADSKAYFKIGVSLENSWKDRLSSVNDRLLAIDTSQGIEKLPLTAEHDHGHDHEKEHRGEKENLDPHIWLSPKRVKLQAESIYRALAKLDPANQAFYQTNLGKFIGDLDSLDREIRQTLSGVKNRKFLVFHPEWGYFAEDYGLEMLSIEVDGNEPGPAQLKDIITEAKKNHIKVIFAQPEFSRKSADTIANEIGGRVVTISAFDENWSENLRRVAKTIAEVLNQ